jgi:tetratricopeptide (TPR) repeat protein
MSPSICLTLIVRDGAGMLPACLGSATGLFHDAVVVDTGSTDDTKALAAAAGARIFDFPWCDDFAAARNEALRHACGDWVFWLDADDRLDESNRSKLQALLAGLTDENAAYVLRVRSPNVDGSASLANQVRLFRNLPELRWRYRVHEQILPAVLAAKHEVRFTDITIEHTGYADRQQVARKQQRNLRLLHLDQRQHPDDPFILFNLGWTHIALDQPYEALPFLRRSLQQSDPSLSIVRKLYALLAGCHRRLGQPREALAACRAGRQVCPDDAELAFLEGQLLALLGDTAAAEACWRALLTENGQAAAAGTAFFSHDEGLHGHFVRHHLAGLCLGQGRAEEAERLWREAVRDCPHFAPAVSDLGKLLLRQMRCEAAEELAIAAEAACPLEAALLRGRVLLARGDLGAARVVLEGTIAAHPAAVMPRVLLSHALLQEGSDLDAAEAVLRDIVARAPGEAESWRNLAVLLRNRGRLQEAAVVCHAGRRHHPDDPDLRRTHGLLLQACGQKELADACLARPGAG